VTIVAYRAGSPKHAQHVRSRLAELEAVIERGMAAFVEMGKALAEVRDSRLYELDFPMFEDYCRERWGVSRTRAYQLIDAARVSTIVDVPNEAQARELAPLLKQGTETIAKVWEKVQERNEPVTAKVVREVVAEVIGTARTGSGSSRSGVALDMAPGALSRLIDEASHAMCGLSILRVEGLEDDERQEAAKTLHWIARQARAIAIKVGSGLPSHDAGDRATSFHDAEEQSLRLHADIEQGTIGEAEALGALEAMIQLRRTLNELNKRWPTKLAEHRLGYEQVSSLDSPPKD
jgi:hypothetical protein